MRALTTISSTFTCHGRREREEDALGDVLRLHRLDASIDRRSLLLVALEADEREVGLDEPRVDGRDADRPAEKILPQRVGEAALGELRRDVRCAVLVRLAARDRAHVDDVTPVAEVRQAEPRHPDEPGHVDGEDGRLVLLARLVERRATQREAGVVDEDVEAAEMLDRLPDEAARSSRRR